MFLSRFSSLLRSNSSVSSLSTALKSLSISTSSSFSSKIQVQETLKLTSVTKKDNPIDKVNDQLKNDRAGRLFAVVHLCGKQFKITEGDIILVEGYWAPTIGDQIRLDKVLVAGSQDFSVIGRPIVSSEVVDVQATIIEKTLSHTRTHFKKKRRKQYMRINFCRTPTTMIRINSINFVEKVDQKKHLLNDREVY